MTTDQGGPNVELLRQTMDEILARPDEHDQGGWATQTDCGTAYCFAGWACKLSGLEADFTRCWGKETARLTNGGSIPDEARRLLGLDRITAFTLFADDNSVADLKHYVDQIAEHGRILDEG